MSNESTHDTQHVVNRTLARQVCVVAPDVSAADRPAPSVSDIVSRSIQTVPAGFKPSATQLYFGVFAVC